MREIGPDLFKPFEMRFETPLSDMPGFEVEFTDEAGLLAAARARDCNSWAPGRAAAMPFLRGLIG